MLPGENVFWTRMIPLWSLLHCATCDQLTVLLTPVPCPPPPVRDTVHRMTRVLCRRRGGEGYQISMAEYVSSHSHTFDDFSRSSALTIAIIAMFYSALSAVATWC